MSESQSKYHLSDIPGLEWPSEILEEAGFDLYAADVEHQSGWGHSDITSGLELENWASDFCQLWLASRGMIDWWPFFPRV